jgi:hypothetical protein
VLTLDWEPVDHPLREPLLPLVTAAAERLELERHLGRLALCLDDIREDERVWVALAPAPPDRPFAADGRPRPDVTLYFHPDHFLKDHAPSAGSVPAAEWELTPAPPRPREAGAFSARKAERTLYHQFLMARDLCDGTVQPATVPAPLVEAFQEAWAVTLDGRLRRAILPGYSQAERRRRFFRVFSAGGVLLPQHWQVFHTLWDWERLDQEELLALLERLPPLPRARAGA